MRRSRFLVQFTLAIAIALAGPQALAAPVVQSTFDSGLEGWARTGDGGSSLVWQATGGNPGGYIQINDAATGTVDWFVAPAAFLGDMSAFVGGTLSFDIRPSTLANPANQPIVQLIGNGNSLSTKLVASDLAGNGVVAGEWNSLSFDLVNTDWYWTGSAVTFTPEGFADVLASLTAIRVLADWHIGKENVGLDNFTLTGPAVQPPSVPEPGSLGLALAGAALLIPAARRRRAAPR